MKRYILMSFVLLIASTTVAQEVYKDEYFELNTSHNQNKSYHYIALDSILLTDGFCYEATDGNMMNLIINPMTTTLPTEGITGGPIAGDDGVVGAIGGTVSVGALGAAVYTIPIEVPAGINGMQPQLAITYNSQAGNGLLGWGWNLSGVSAITRTNNTDYHDANNKEINFNNDALMLDGQRLIKILNNGNKIEYKTEQDEFSRILFYIENNKHIKCEIWKDNGLIINYGFTDDSRLMTSDGTNVIKWMISSIVDRNGNKITYQYNTDNITGECYLDKIEYTSNEAENITPQFTVKLYYDDVQDFEYSYIAGNLIQDRKILDSINVIKNNNINLLNYTFDYDRCVNGRFYDSINMYDKLVTVGLKKNGMKLNPTRISWNGDYCDDVSFQKILASNLDGTIYEDFSFIGDFNGDGYSDLLTVPFKGNGEYSDSMPEMNVYLNSQNESFYSYPAMSSLLPQTLEWIHVLDFNDDKFDDIIVHLYDPTNQDNTIFWVFENINGQGLELKLTKTYSGKAIVLTGDFMGNGKTCAALCPIAIVNDNPSITKTDIVYHTDNTYSYCTPILPYNNIRHIVCGDFTGNKKDDFLFVMDNMSSVYSLQAYGSSDGFFFNYEYRNHYSSSSMRYNSNKWNYFFPGDFNGDEKTDILYYDHFKTTGSRLNIFFSTGVGFEHSVCPLSVILPEYNLYSYSLSRIEEEPECALAIADFDGDGKSDIARFSYINNSSNSVSFFLNYNKDEGAFLSTFNPRGHVSNIGLLDCKSQYFNVGNFIGKDNVSFLSLRWVVFPNNKHKPVIYSLRSVSELYSVKDITDGLGNTISFTYEYLMPGNNGIYEQTSDLNKYGIKSLPIPIYALKNYSEANCGDGINKISYKYYNTLYHKTGHGLIGFEKITRTEQVNDTYLNTHTSLFEIETMNQNAFALPSLDSIYVYNNDNKILAEVKEYQFDNVKYNDNIKVVRPAMRKNIIKTFNVDKPGTLLYKSIFEYTYNYDNNKKYADTYNCTEIKNGTDVNDISECENATYLIKEKVSFYDNDIQNWVVNRENLNIITNSVKNKPDVVRKTKYNYSSDNPYLITKITNTPSNYDNDPLTTCKLISYDALGNITKETLNTPYGKKGEQNVEIEYEYYKNRIISKKTIDKKGLNYSESYSYDKYDKINSYSDFSNLIHTYITNYINNTTITISPNNIETAEAFLWAKGHELAPEGALYYKWNKTSGGKTNVTFYHKTGSELRHVSYDHEDNPIIIDKKYNNKGNLTNVSNPYKSGENIIWTNYMYDNLGRIAYTTSPHNITRYSYNGLNTTTIVYSDPSTYQYSTNRINPMGWLTSYTDQDNNTIQYDYYSDGKIASASSGNIKLELKYDNAGNRIYLNDPDYGVTTSEYDAYGRLLKQTTPKGDSSSYAYDILNRLVQKVSHKENTITNYYYNNFDKKGTISKITHDRQIVTYEYDDLLRPISICEKISNDTYTTDISYDEASRVSDKTYPSGYMVKYDYYDNGILKSISDSDDNILWQVDDINARGQIMQSTTGNGATTNYTYDTKGRLIRNVTSNNINNFSYTYDKFDNLASRSDSVVHNRKELFEYDNLNRLTRSYSNNSVLNVMKYDRQGRMVMKRQNNDTIFYNSQFSSSKPHALISANIDSVYSSFRNQDVVYTSFSKVKTIAETNKYLSFTYGHDNQRISMTEIIKGKERKKTYVDDCEFVVSNGIKTSFTYLTSPDGVFAVVVKERGVTYIFYIYKDHLGSWTSIADSEGNVRQYLRYDVWGNLTHVENGNGNIPNKPLFDRGFTGHEHHYDFGLINMNGRMYDPMMSSFLSPDNYVQEPVTLQSLNRYAYCLYNPLKYIDPSGERMTDPPHTSMVLDYVSQMNTSGVYDSDLTRQLNLLGITDIEYVNAPGYSGGTIRWSEGNYEYTYSYESDMNDGTLSSHYIGGYGAGYNYPVFIAGGGSYSIPNANLTGNGGGGMSVASTAATVAGTGASIGAEMFYSRTYKTWMGKNWKMYKQTWNGNQHTGGKLSYGKKNSDILRKVGNSVIIYNGYELINERIDDNISTFELCTEVAILIYSARGGIYGIAVGVGWELGRLITFTEAYQEFKFNLHYNMYENKFGAPSESNEYLWNEFYKNYQP